MTGELCIDVIESFRALQHALAELTALITEHDAMRAAWFQCPNGLHVSPDDSQRTSICHFINQLEYLETQAPKEILVGPGLLAASLETINAVENVNASKQHFKAAMLALKAAKVSIQDPRLKDNMEALLASRPQGMKDTLKKMGLARLHLKQSYRLIPFFTERPHKVSWTWAHTRSIKRISVAQAFDRLQKYRLDVGIEVQISKLAKLPPHEPLAIVQELAPHLRANILFANGERKMVKGPVPLFYLDAGFEALPIFNPPKEKSMRNAERLVRNDVKLNPEPFLPAIRAHRYREAVLDLP